MHILVLHFASRVSNEEIHSKVEMLLMLQSPDQETIMPERELLVFFCAVQVMLL